MPNIHTRTDASKNPFAKFTLSLFLLHHYHRHASITLLSPLSAIKCHTHTHTHTCDHMSHFPSLTRSLSPSIRLSLVKKKENKTNGDDRAKNKKKYKKTQIRSRKGEEKKRSYRHQQKRSPQRLYTHPSPYVFSFFSFLFFISSLIPHVVIVVVVQPRDVR